MKIPVRVSGVVRGLAISRGPAVGAIGFAPALALHLTADGVLARSAESLNIAGSTARVLAQPTSERERLSDACVPGRGQDHGFERRSKRYPALTGAGNKVAVT